MSRIIRQTVTLSASPHQVYEALMDSRQHSRLTGEPARISRKVGGEISAYGGYITGRNVALTADELIVQTWRASDWPAGVESQVTFRLTAVPAGTRLTFTHSNVPDDQYEAIKQGWIDWYWTPLKTSFSGKK